MAVFVIGARTPEGWDFLFEKYQHSFQMSVKSRLKSAMTVTPLKDKLKWWVHYIAPFLFMLSISPSSALSHWFLRFHFLFPFHYPLTLALLFILYSFLQDDGAEPQWWDNEDTGPTRCRRRCQPEPTWLQTGLGLPPSQLAHHDQEVSQHCHANTAYTYSNF